MKLTQCGLDFSAYMYQMVDLLEAVDSLKDCIMSGDDVALGKVEQAVDMVARRIDVYLILAVRE